MARKKQAPPSQSSRHEIRTGNIADVSGNLNIATGDIIQTVDTGLGAEEIKQLFSPLYAKIAARPRTSTARKKQLTSEVEEIQETVTAAMEKKEKVSESFLSRRFQNIARVAPDVLDVVVATLASPLAGLGVAAKKVAEKAKAEAK